MRLMALRQPPKEISRPVNSGHPKSTPEPLKDPFPLPLFVCKPISSDTEKCGSAKLRDAPYGGAVQAPRKPALSIALIGQTTLNAETCIDHMFPNTAIDTLSPQVPPLVDTQTPTKTPRGRRPGSEVWPRDGGGTKAQPKRLVDRRRIYSHATHSTKTREPSETNQQEEQDSGTCPRARGTTDSASPPPLVGKH